MFKSIKFAVLFFIFVLSTFSQNKINIKTLRSDFARLPRQNQEYQLAIKNIPRLLSSDSANVVREGLIKAELYFVKNDTVETTIKNILENFSAKPKKLLLSALELSKSLYSGVFTDQYRNILEETTDPLIFAYTLNSMNDRNKFIPKIDLKFPDITNNPIIKCLKYDLATKDSDKFTQRPSLEDLLDHEFQNDKTIIYTFFRSNRSIPGISIIKKPDGTFVKNENDEIFSIPQLGLSYANYPGYLKNGNTPEGIFSIVGTYISPTESIGPTRNILTRIAYEVTPEIFYHGENENNHWRLEDYQNLLPDSWQEYFPIYEAYYAGQAGRKVIIMHGSADDLRFFEGKPYYPHTPTMGCISSIETWNQETGYCIRSDQADLINAFYSTGQIKGFLVVVELDNKKTPVTIDDLQDFF